MTTQKLRPVLIWCPLLALFANCLQAQNLVQRLDGQSSVDWTRYVVRASGISNTTLTGADKSQRVDALMNAKAAAADNLLKAIKKLRLSGNSAIQDAFSANTLLRSRVHGYAQRFTVVDTRSMSDMSIEVDVELPILEGLAQLFLPDRMGRGEFHLDDIPRSPLSLMPWPECREVPDGVELVIPSQGLVSYKGRPYTGLIIDARGLGVNPSVLPRILNERLEQVYGSRYAARDAVVASGLVAYFNSMAEARRDRRSGREPLVICAVKSHSSKGADVIVSDNDAVLIHAAAFTRNFLHQARVVFVVGARP